MGFFSIFSGLQGWSKEKLRDELLRLQTRCSRGIFSHPLGADAALAERKQLEDRCKDIQVELRRRGLADSETYAEVMDRIQKKRI